MAATILSAKFIACELWEERVCTFGEVLYRNQWPVNFILHFSEFQSDSSIRYKITLFENYIHKCYMVKRILISFNCFSEYISFVCADAKRPRQQIFSYVVGMLTYLPVLGHYTKQQMKYLAQENHTVPLVRLRLSILYLWWDFGCQS